MKYDFLVPKDIEPYLGSRSWEELKVGDEIAFPDTGWEDGEGWDPYHEVGMGEQAFTYGRGVCTIRELRESK